MLTTASLAGGRGVEGPTETHLPMMRKGINHDAKRIIGGCIRAEGPPIMRIMVAIGLFPAAEKDSTERQPYARASGKSVEPIRLTCNYRR